uniref:Transposase (Putative), gypsy type n=1 Tax=Tanacetum cinerariifolium TaxID=118510 RepID=A0A6L2LY06_TANCI|nr:hypothetical protein [Tanacetum cinerariifolium]
MTATWVMEMEDLAAATDSSGVPSTIERSPLDFSSEAGPEDQGTMAPEVPLPKDVPTTRGAPEASQPESVVVTVPPVITESRKRSSDRVDANAPLKVLRRDRTDPRPTRSNRGGKSLAAIELGMGSTRPTLVPLSGPADASDPDPLSFANPESSQGTAAAGDPESENTSYASMVGSPEGIYRPEWGYFLELRHLHNDDFLRQYNVNLARQVAIGSQLGLRFEQEAKLLRKSVARVARLDKKIQAREHEIKNLEALLEAKADMKKAAEDKSARLSQELEDMRALFSDLQVNNDRLSQQVATLQEHVSGEEKLKATFEEFKRWMIGHGLRLAVMKCGESLELRQAFADVVSAWIAKGMSEGLRHRVEHRQAQLTLESIEAYGPKTEAKYIAALQALKDRKYPLVDQLEGLKDAPMDVIMAALYLESDTGDDAPQWVRDLRPKMLLADAIAANVSRAKKKKKCRIVCRTHGVGSAHHSRSHGVPVSMPTVIPQGLALLLADAATQTEPDEATLGNL